MAEIAQHVVNEASEGGSLPSEDIATPSNPESADGEAATAHNLAYTPSDIADQAGNAVLESRLEHVVDANGKSDDGVQASNDNVLHSLGDASGGSDTDTSRPDVVELGKDSQGHIRTGSVKKTASFKPVSVTKSFLAKSLSASPGVRLGDKPTTTTTSSSVSILQSARPRLVAKSALGGIQGRGLIKVNGTGGPDASKVWNKNRPVPPPPPRQFTDEELQTHYGIHMATRLQSDEPGKDSKWADIDDDEDDWAPETVEWMDGTKSSVVAAEAPPALAPLQEDRLPEVAAAVQPAEVHIMPVTVVQQPPASSSTKTILRPGSQLNNAQKVGTQKSGLDKSVSATNSSAPLPVKSPWATLPPVENVAPLNLPVQNPSRAFQRDPHGFESLPPIPATAKEIAADDFNRTWRDDRGGKELFNAQSGRYEPAGEASKGSRQDQNHRQPAVLQRPSQNFANGPAEPSAAFQTSRSILEGSSWPRRRTSSNLSSAGGRRPSLAQSHDLPQPSMDRLDTKSPVSVSVTEVSNGPLAAEEHTHGEHVLKDESSSGEGPKELHPSQEDPVAIQQRMMRERIERARLQKQREQEDEHAEKAARQERLKLKMAALAAPIQSPEPKETKPSTEIGPSQVSIQPPKPPVPTSEGEVAQYGMMKVHQPHPVKKQPISSDLSLHNKRGAEAPSDADKVPFPPSKTQAQSTIPHLPSTSAPNENAIKRPSDSSASTEKLVGPWKSPSPQDYNWGPNTMNARSSVGANVWGPPMNIERSLGNGVFESKFSHSNFDNNKFDSRLDNRLDNNRLDHALPAAHGPIGAAIKSSTPPRQSHFTQTFLNSEKPLQEQPDDQDIASTHLGSSLQHSIAQSSSLNPLQTAPTAALSKAFPTHMATAQVALAPKPATSYPSGTSSGWMPSQQRSTKADWAAFGALDKQRREQQQREYAKEYEQKQASRLPEIKKVTYSVFKETPAGVDEIFCRVEDDGSVYTHVLARHNKDVNSLCQVEQSKIDHPEHYKDHLDASKLREPPAVVYKRAASKDSTSFDLQHKPKASTDAMTVLVVNATNDLGTRPPAEQGLFEVAANDQIKVRVPKVAKVSLPFSSAYPKAQQAQALLTTSSAVNVAHHAQSTFSAMPAVKGASKEPMTWAELNQKFASKRHDINANTKPAFDVSTANQGRSIPNGTGVRNATAVAFPPTAVDVGTYDVLTSRPCDDDLFGAPEFGAKPTVRVPSMAHKNHQFGYSHDLQMTLATRPHSRLHRHISSQSISIDVDTALFAPRIERSIVKYAILLPGMEPSQTKVVETTAKACASISYRKHNISSRRPFPSKNSTAHNNDHANNGIGPVGFGHNRDNKPIKPLGHSLSSRQRSTWTPRKMA